MQNSTTNMKVTQKWEVLPRNINALQEATWEWIKKGFEVQQFTDYEDGILCLFVKRETWDEWKKRQARFGNYQSPNTPTPTQPSESSDDLVF